MKPVALLFAAFIPLLAACNAESPVRVDDHAAHKNGVALSGITQSTTAQTLNDLRALTAAFHDVDAAEQAQYGLFILAPLTAPDGCVSSASEGGMGYHYTRGNNLADDDVTLLDPEFL